MTGLDPAQVIAEAAAAAWQAKHRSIDWIIASAQFDSAKAAVAALEAAGLSVTPAPAETWTEYGLRDADGVDGYGDEQYAREAQAYRPGTSVVCRRLSGSEWEDVP